MASQHSANCRAFSYVSHSKTLEDRLKLEAKNGTLNVSDTTVGSKQLTFTLKRVSRLPVLLPDSLMPACSAPWEPSPAAPRLSRGVCLWAGPSRAKGTLCALGRAGRCPRVLVT